MVKFHRAASAAFGVAFMALAAATGCTAEMGDVGEGFEGGESVASEEDLGSVSQAIGSTTVDVIEATYGANCGAARSNATWHVVNSCDGKSNCAYRISTSNLGDPKRGCEKDFDVRFACGTSGVFTVHANREANGQTITLACPSNPPTNMSKIRVQDATYGMNCGQPQGNVTWDVAPYCDGFGTCKYDIRTSFLGDPRRGCEKEFVVNYTCDDNPTRLRQAFASREANGKTVTLTCPKTT